MANRPLVVVALALTAGCTTVAGDGNIASVTFQRGRFSALVNSTQLPVVVVHDTSIDNGSVTITCDDNLIDYVELSGGDDDGVLDIDPFEDVGLAPSDPNNCFVRAVTDRMRRLGNDGTGSVRSEGPLPQLYDLQSAGTGSISVSGAAPESPDTFTVSSTGSGAILVDGADASLVQIANEGSGQLDVLDLFADDVEIRSTGSGGIEAAGRTVFLDLTATGTGAVDAGGLEASDVLVELTGSGATTVTARGSVNGVLGGTGSLTVRGAPGERDVRETGTGQVTFEE